MNFEQWLKDYLKRQYQDNPASADAAYGYITANPGMLRYFQSLYSGRTNEAEINASFPKWMENKYRGMDERFIVSNWRRLTENPTAANALERAYLMREMKILGYNTGESRGSSYTDPFGSGFGPNSFNQNEQIEYAKKFGGLTEQQLVDAYSQHKAGTVPLSDKEKQYVIRLLGQKNPQYQNLYNETYGTKTEEYAPLDWQTLYQQGQNSAEGGIESQIQEYLRRIGTGEFNAGQLYEFMGRVGLLRNFQGDNQLANLPSYDPRSPQYQPPALDPKTFFNEDFINKTFNATAGNINQAGSSMASQARNAAAALGGSRGLVNPSAFTLSAGSRASAPYAAQLGENEANRANALYGMNKDLFGAYKGQQDFSEDARRFGLNFGESRTQNLFNRSIQNFGLAEAFREGKSDIWGALLQGLLQAGTSYLSSGSSGGAK